MFESLDDVPWAMLATTYANGEQIPACLRQLTDSDVNVRVAALHRLVDDVFHQGTRYSASPYVIPFLSELCAAPATPDRGKLLELWGLIAFSYYDSRMLPEWSDGTQVYDNGTIKPWLAGTPYADILASAYYETLSGLPVLQALLNDKEETVRAHTAKLLGALVTVRDEVVPALKMRLGHESSAKVRTSIVFALGMQEASGTLRNVLAKESEAMVQCMAACQLARVSPESMLVKPLMAFIQTPIDGYEHVPGAGGKSMDDAAHALLYLPLTSLQEAIPALCERLTQARSFDVVPVVEALLVAVFEKQREKRNVLNEKQKQVLRYLVLTPEVWPIGDVQWLLEAHGLPRQREACAALAETTVPDDEAHVTLSRALAFAQMGFFEQARAGIDEALAIDPDVLDAHSTPEDGWFLCAQVFAYTDPERARHAFTKATALSPSIAEKLHPASTLAGVLEAKG